MTMPIERYWSISNTREFLYALLDPKKTPKVPKYVRKHAAACLRHYPTGLDMEMARTKAPKVFGHLSSKEKINKRLGINNV